MAFHSLWGCIVSFIYSKVDIAGARDALPMAMVFCIPFSSMPSFWRFTNIGSNGPRLCGRSFLCGYSIMCLVRSLFNQVSRDLSKKPKHLIESLVSRILCNRLHVYIIYASLLCNYHLSPLERFFSPGFFHIATFSMFCRRNLDAMFRRSRRMTIPAPGCTVWSRWTYTSSYWTHMWELHVGVPIFPMFCRPMPRLDDYLLVDSPGFALWLRMVCCRCKLFYF